MIRDCGTKGMGIPNARIVSLLVIIHLSNRSAITIWPCSLLYATDPSPMPWSLAYRQSKRFHSSTNFVYLHPTVPNACKYVLLHYMKPHTHYLSVFKLYRAVFCHDFIDALCKLRLKLRNENSPQSTLNTYKISLNSAKVAPLASRAYLKRSPDLRLSTFIKNFPFPIGLM